MASGYGTLSHDAAGLPAGEQAIRRRCGSAAGALTHETVVLRARTYPFVVGENSGNTLQD